MMRKTLLGIFLALAVAVMAGQRSPEQAAAIAAQFTNEQPQLRLLHKAPRTAATMRLVHQAKRNNSEEAAYYVFNQENKNGFVIVSADDRTAKDVLIYSTEGAFNPETVNPHFQWWLQRFTDEISSIEGEAEMSMAPQIEPAKSPIAPLLKNQDGEEITWYQEAPYYNYCPIDRLDNTRCLTGCVATAASMVMYKWRWPEKGVGTSSYTWHDCLETDWWGNCRNSYDTILSANYGETTYQWDNMLPSYANAYPKPSGTQKAAVAKLMYHVGVSSEMEYGGNTTGGSGALLDYLAYGLMTHFRYRVTKFLTMYSKYYYGEAHDSVPAEYNVTVDKFTTYFNAELEAGRPIVMGGRDSSSGGHAFVCDGRDNDGRYHINWGWEGDGNCYTTLTTLQPDGESYKFNEGIDAVLGIEPDIKEAIEQVALPEKATKVLENGQVVILREGVRYTILGQLIQ